MLLSTLTTGFNVLTSPSSIYCNAARLLFGIVPPQAKGKKLGTLQKGEIVTALEQKVVEVPAAGGTGATEPRQVGDINESHSSMSQPWLPPAAAAAVAAAATAAAVACLARFALLNGVFVSRCGG